MKQAGFLMLALVAWLAYQAGKSAAVSEVVSGVYPGAARPGY